MNTELSDVAIRTSASLSACHKPALSRVRKRARAQQLRYLRSVGRRQVALVWRRATEHRQTAQARHTAQRVLFVRAEPFGTKFKPVSRLGEDGGWFHLDSEPQAVILARTEYPDAACRRCPRRSLSGKWPEPAEIEIESLTAPMPRARGEFSTFNVDWPQTTTLLRKSWQIGVKSLNAS